MKRIHSNAANSVLVYGIAIILMAVMLTGISIDYTKSVYIKKQYTSYAQQATEVAMKQQNGIGSLTPNAVNKFVYEYMAQRDPKTVGIEATSESASFRHNKCATSVNYPIIEIRFDTDRRVGTANTSPTYTSKGGVIPWLDNADFNAKKYVVMNVKVTDVSDNWLFGMFGFPCQTHEVETSAVAINADWNRT